MRIAYLDMTNLDRKCPSGFDVVTSPKKACIRTNVPASGGCTSVEYPTHGFEYTKVCGRVRGYQDSSPDGFYPYHDDNGLTLEDGYVDGVSITQGSSPRRHIWTFTAGLDEDESTNGQFSCPCAATDGSFDGTVPPFINQDYFCESASDGISQFGSIQFVVFPDDPLWDGQDCPSGNTCCTDRNPPWFCREVDPSTDNIELRVCTNEDRANEDLQLEVVEIYVQ